MTTLLLRIYRYISRTVRQRPIFQTYLQRIFQVLIWKHSRDAFRNAFLQGKNSLTCETFSFQFLVDGQNGPNGLNVVPIVAQESNAGTGFATTRPQDGVVLLVRDQLSRRTNVPQFVQVTFCQTAQISACTPLYLFCCMHRWNGNRPELNGQDIR